LREEQIRTFSRGVIRNGIDSIAAAPLAARVLSVLISHGHHDAVFNQAIETARRFVSDNRESFRRRVAKNSIHCSRIGSTQSWPMLSCQRCLTPSLPHALRTAPCDSSIGHL
jgi:uncharacterized membrane-anchored protein YjiN (DUF445 family)